MRLNKICVMLVPLVLLACDPKVMTRDELRSYVQAEDHGLAKKISGAGVDTEIFYWPYELLFEEGEGYSGGRSANDVHYFMVKGESRYGNTWNDASAAKLIVEGDTLETLDALVIPQVDAMNRSGYRILLAFPSSHDRPKARVNVVLLMRVNGTLYNVRFTYSDIERAKEIEIRN